MTENVAPIPSIPEHRYKSPSVIEALCEIYFTGSTWDPTTPGLFYERVRNDYPLKAQLPHQVGFEMQLGPGQAEPRSLPVETRMRFARKDNSRVLQLARDALIVNQLLPYPRYEEWRAAVHAALDIYRELAAPPGIDRLGVRYLNRINVPDSTVRLNDYFRVIPAMPRELKRAPGLFQLSVPILPLCADHQLMLTIGMGGPTGQDGDPIMLDLYDVLALGGQDVFENVPRFLDEAHANLVHAFENTITDMSRNLFGGNALE